MAEGVVDRKRLKKSRRYRYRYRDRYRWSALPI
jgi:hypothetical protein